MHARRSIEGRYRNRRALRKGAVVSAHAYGDDSLDLHPVEAGTEQSKLCEVFCIHLLVSPFIPAQEPPFSILATRLLSISFSADNSLRLSGGTIRSINVCTSAAFIRGESWYAGARKS